MVCNNDPASHIIRAQNQCPGHQGLLVSRAPILPRLAAQCTQRNSSISHVTLSPCHHVTTSPYNHFFILHPRMSILIVVSGIRLKKSLLRFHLKLKRTFFALVNQSRCCFGQMSDRQDLQGVPKKCTNRMLLEPWCTGETTSGWHHLTLESVFLVVSY